MRCAIDIKYFLVGIMIILLGPTFFGLGCEKGTQIGPGEEVTIEEGEEEVIPPEIIEITPPDRSSISKTREIVIKFSRSMDPGTLVLEGAMANESDGGVWSQSASDNDTLTISPTTSWSLGTKTLSIACNDTAGNPLSQTLGLTYGIHVVYVKSGEMGDGTMDAPMGNINDAITNALTKFPIPSQVHVAFGLYKVNSEDSSYIVLKEGVSLFGGFTAEDWTARDPSTNITTIKDICTTGGDLVNYLPTRAIEAGANITEDTVIDGFKIQGGAGKFSSAIYSHDCQGPTISNNIISSNSIKASMTIFNKASSPRILNNTIFTGTSSMLFAAGIVNMSNCSAVISGNTIKGGSGQFIAGIISLDSASTIYNNVIDGGPAASGSKGISLESSSPRIYNNTIDGGSGINESTGVDIQDNSHPLIINNIIFSSGGTKRYGINEEATASDPANLMNNDVFDCPTALYHDDETTDLKYACIGTGTFGNSDATCAVQKLIKPDPPDSSGNVDLDPKFESADNWHLSTSSPTEVTGGGLDLSADFQTDKDGNLRSVPWSMGAYEYD